MAKTPDRHDGPLYEEGIYLEVDRPAAATPGEIRYTGTKFSMFDGVGEFDPHGLNAEQHAALRQLIHLADGDGPFEGFASGAYCETLPAADPFPTSMIWYTASDKLHKIVEETITYNPNKTIATDQWKVYNAAGNLLVTVTDTISYSGVFETSRTRTIA